jgi:hypothetical protein
LGRASQFGSVSHFGCGAIKPHLKFHPLKQLLLSIKECVLSDVKNSTNFPVFDEKKLCGFCASENRSLYSEKMKFKDRF